jgi:protein-disulfide isomerase
MKPVHQAISALPIAAALIAALAAGCGGAQRCPEVDEEAIAERAAEIVLERLADDKGRGTGHQIAGTAADKGETGPADATHWPTRSDLPGADEERHQVPIDGAPWRGAETPLVTIVEFIDFQCPYCGKVQETLNRLLEEHPEDLRLVFRHHPLDFHPQATIAATAAAEAYDQGGNRKFWRMHDLLFQDRRALDSQRLESYAREIGLDHRRFRRALDGGAHDEAIEEDCELAVSLGARGTPAFFINGRLLSGAQPYEAFERAIQQEIELAREALHRGARREQIYETAMAAIAVGDDEELDEEEEEQEVYYVPTGDSPAQGPKDALVTVVMFTDVQCPFCDRAYRTARAVRDRFDDEVRIVIKNHPLPMHADAMQAHQALMEARAQKGDEAAFAMLELMFDNMRNLERGDLVRLARKLKLSLPRFRNALKREKHHKAIDSDLALARRVGVRGTPTFFVNGVKLVGAANYYTFFDSVRDALERAEELVSSGVPRGRVYERIIEHGIGDPQKP